MTSDQQQQFPNLPSRSREIITPGINNDGWWKTEDLIRQIMEKAIPTFEVTHLNCIAVFAFDNAQSHAAFAKDALVASRMNMKPGGNQPKMRNTIFNRQIQTMNFPDNYFDQALQENQRV